MLEPEFIENTFFYMTKPKLLESLSQESAPLKIENEHLSNKTKFTLLASLRQDFDLSIKGYSLLREVNR